ncbi:Disease resistance protein RPM1 [Acorus calamus]|uniref:Disease resistance protein RPM1 n=1 Tax=Acorus calamus TaxID=4465 RepID=A0AAV9EAV8_ACOCL|nr:Disease resistance protein RPM1 [Acorus calamus]
MAERILGGLVTKIGSVVAVQAMELVCLKKEMKRIMKELEAMQPVIEQAYQVRDINGSVAVWIREVKEMALDIEDILDEFTHLVGEHERTISGSIKKYVHRLKNAINWIRVSEELKDIRTQLEDIHKRKIQYDDKDMRGISIAPADDPIEIREHRAAVSLINRRDEILFGIEENRTVLIDWLTNDEETKCGIIAVQGMGGIGKTTLVAQVYNHQEVMKNFNFRAWVTVSQTYTIDNVLESILHQFFQEEHVEPNAQMIDRVEWIQKIHDHMQQQRCVIFFDDIWSIDGWDDIRDIFPISMCRSKIVYTTRDYDVASKLASEDFVFKLQPLKEDKAWALFCKRAFHGSCCPGELEDLARELVKRCEGLPLAIIVLGGLMCSKTSITYWRMVLSGFESFLGGDQRIKDILKLSLEVLPYQLKNCFLYCSAFPEDFLFRKNKIIRLWVAEGFVEGKKGMTMEEVAEGYFDNLISRSLLHVAVIRYIFEETEGFKMHDLVREMAVTISQEENFCMMYNGGELQPKNRTRRLSLHKIEDNMLKSKNKMSRLRTLMMFGHPTSFPRKTLNNVAFSACRSMRVLDLEGVRSLNGLPNAVGNLFNLRFLSLRNTNVRKLPESIAKLNNLQTLDLTYSKVHKLPNGIRKLTKLRHMMLPYWNSSIQMPGSIGDLKDMQTLIGIRANSQVIQEVGDLTQLRSLGIGDVKTSDGAKLSDSLAKLKCLVSLSMESDESSGRLQLETLNPPQCLAELKFDGRLNALPLWFGYLANLTRLVLRGCKLREDPIPSLQSLPKLAYLWLGSAFDGRQMRVQGRGFPSLIQLQLIGLNELNEIIIEEGAMKRLELLELRYCTELKKLPMGIEFLTRLQEFRIYDMPKEFLERLGSVGEDHPKVRHIPIVLIDWEHIDHYFSEWRTRRI